MLNKEMSAGTNAEQSTNDETRLPSSPTCGNTNVVRSPFSQTTNDQIKLECLKIAALYAGSPETVKRLYKEFVELFY